MNTAEINEKAKALFGECNYHIKVNGVQKDGTKVVLRLFRHGEDVCFFRSGSRKRGYYLSEYGSSMNPLVDIIPIVHKKTTAQKWESAWKKVKAKLEVSGLWDEVQEEISIALDIGYEKMKLAYDKYWEIQDEEKKIEFLKTTDARLIGLNDEKKEYTKSSLIWNYAKIPKVKTMYFGKWKNERFRERIKQAMEVKKSTREGTQAGYDVSFEYNAEKNKVWYSEEYRGCGNGHYYIALNASHALFVEDD